MFDNIGSKIKTVAQTLCWIGIIASVLLAVILIGIAFDAPRSTESLYITMGIVVLLVGPLLSWLSSLTLYGFGELIERSASIDKQLTAQYSLLSKLGAQSPVNPSAESKPARPAQPTQKIKTEKAPDFSPIVPVEAKPGIQQKPVVASNQPAEKAASVNAYDAAELQILMELRKEGKLSEDEYQKCLSDIKN